MFEIKERINDFIKKITRDKWGRIRFSVNWVKAKLFKFKYGFDEAETWDLDLTIARFLIPRLKMLKERLDEKYAAKNSISNSDYNKIIKGFENIIKLQDNYDDWEKKWKNKEIAIRTKFDKIKKEAAKETIFNNLKLNISYQYFKKGYPLYFYLYKREVKRAYELLAKNHEHLWW